MSDDIHTSMASMTFEQRREHIDQLEHAAVKAEQEEKEAALRAKVAAATEVSLAGNEWYQAKLRGEGLTQRVTYSNGQTTVEDLSRPANADSTAFAAPQSLVDKLPVRVGGIELGPQQAKDMLARGEISQADYRAGVNEALKPYGYSFR